MARIAENTDDRKQTLLRAAARMVEIGGASSLSMRALAAETGTSPKSAYELFGSKDGLLIALLKERRAAFVHWLGELEDCDGLARVFQAIELTGRGISEDFNFIQAASMQYFSPSGKEIRAVFSAERRQLIKALLDEVAVGERIGIVENEVLSNHLETIYIGALFNWMLCDGTEEIFVRQFGLGCALSLRGVMHEGDHAYLDSMIGKFSA